MLTLEKLVASDTVEIAAAFAKLGWNKPVSQYEMYLLEQTAGERVVVVARWDGAFVGYVTVLWRSHYPPFAQEGIPEIADFNVLPDWRRRGIGTALLDEVEHLVLERSPVVGIGVGMTADYGAAQRLYVQRGYLPDGRGLHYENHPVVYGTPVPVDDDLVLYFTKSARRG